MICMYRKVHIWGGGGGFWFTKIMPPHKSISNHRYVLVTCTYIHTNILYTV